MKRFLSAVVLCLGLMSVGMFSLLPNSSVAKENILQVLLDLPAPPPPNPFYKVNLIKRTESFYDKNNPPKDDAPIEDLLDYWKHQNSTYRELGYNVKPSVNSLKRIASEIEQNPEMLKNFINILPESSDTADFVGRVYEQYKSKPDVDRWELERIKKWLTLNSDQFSDELLASAKRAGDVREYVTNHDELVALARIDWEKARPVVESLYNDSTQRVSKVLARWAFYKHALETDSFGDIERYREELKAVVEDKSATPGMRDLAFDALVKEKEWNGRDEWYFTLLEDETLADLRVNGSSYTGLTTIILYSSPDKYADKMLELIVSKNLTVRQAAIRNLGQIVDKDHPEVVKALLPWLEKPDWAKNFGDERNKLIRVLQDLEMPESVPGLVDLLDEKKLEEVYVQPNSVMSGNSANRMVSNSYYPSNSITNSAYYANSGAVKTTIEYYPHRYSAVQALAKQKDIRAVSALKRILPQAAEYERGQIVKALLVSGGFSISEQVEALEKYAQGVKSEIQNEIEQEKMMADAAGTIERVEPYARSANIMIVSNSSSGNYANRVMNSMSGRPFNPMEIKELLGGQIAMNPEPNADFLKTLVERIEVLDRKDAQLSQALRRIMQKWSGAAVNALLLNDLKNNKLEINAIVKLLSIRKELREKQSNDVFNIRGGSPLALGISACFLEDKNEYDAILANENTEVKAAMLACARLIRAELPIQKVAENLKSQDKMLAIAAEKYLESEDSPEARQIVLSLYPNKAKILGARSYFGQSGALGGMMMQELFASVYEYIGRDAYYFLLLESSDDDELKETEKKLQNEVLDNQELLGIYAYDDNFIRIYKDRAVFSWEENVARYRERVLEKDEFDNFKAYLASQKVDELVPFLGTCSGCSAKELVMLGRGGGRRVYVRADPLPEFFAEIEKMFEEMRHPPAKLHYWLEKDIAGLEILFADDNLQAVTLWKNGADFRLLIENQQRLQQIENELFEYESSLQQEDLKYYQILEKMRQRREQTQSQHLNWFKFSDGKASDISGLPPLFEYPPTADGLAVSAGPEQWKARTPNFEIRANEEGLYKKTGRQITKIHEGYYSKPVVSADGRWAVAVNYSNERNLVRVNLQTGREFPVNLEETPYCEASFFINSLSKFLLLCGYPERRYGDDGSGGEPKITGEYYLLDAETGVIQRAKGEFRPLDGQTFRPLQPTGKADEFWAAIPGKNRNETQFGIFNAKTFTFRETLKIPSIVVDSMNTWVDTGEGKIYLVYEGHLLSIPLK